MTQLTRSRAAALATGARPPRRAVRAREVWARRLVGLVVMVVPVAWAWARATPPSTDLVNAGGVRLLADLFAGVLDPALDGQFLVVVLRAAGATLAFATLGTAGALLIGAVGGLALSDVAWGRRPSWPVRATRWALRGLLVLTRSVHELVWALLLVSVLGLDPLVAVLAIALPFGAQTAQVFGDVLDGVAPGPLRSLRSAGARPGPALAYGLLPGAAPLLVSYSFYRFECAIRSSVLLGVVGIAGLGQELVVSLQSRNWDEVWTLVGAVVLLSAVVDRWSRRVRGGLSVATCAEWTVAADGGRPAPGAGSGRRRSWLLLVPVALVLAWSAAGVSWVGLGSARTRDLTVRLLDDLTPPQLPDGGADVLVVAVLDTVAMAVLAMAVAVGLTVLLAPWAAAVDRGPRPAPGRRVAAWVAQGLLVVLRSIPPTVWAVVALLALFPGILPGALALGLYTGGILGRLVAEAWESVDLAARDALVAAGVRPAVATTAARTPASAHHLVTYTLYRFEICVRDTTVVGVVGAAGLGRLLAESLSSFRFPVVASVLVASFAVSVVTELVGRRLRRAIRAQQD